MKMYQLVIYMESGHILSIYGIEDILGTEIRQWEMFETNCADEWLEAESRGETYKNVEGCKPRQLCGYSDSVSRRERTLMYRFQDVHAMELTEL